VDRVLGEYRIPKDSAAGRRHLERALEERRGPEHDGSERQETAEVLAEGIVAAELKRRRWTEAEWGRRAKGDAGKVAIAVRLRAETVMTVKWIAQRLRMGAPGYVHHLLYGRRKTAGG
jgi:hypothetical protein